MQQVVEGKAISVKLVPQFKKTSRPCRGFQAGICRKGDACKYVTLEVLLTVGASGVLPDSCTDTTT